MTEYIKDIEDMITSLKETYPDYNEYINQIVANLQHIRKLKCGVMEDIVKGLYLDMMLYNRLIDELVTNLGSEETNKILDLLNGKKVKFKLDTTNIRSVYGTRAI